MIFNACGVVLWRRDQGEYDRVVALYTPSHGKVHARFGGVNRSAGKLKAVSEPLAWAEYRLHLNPRTQGVRVLGGRLIDSFPRLRTDLPRTLAALSCCEMLSRLSPERDPNPAKYELLVSALSLLDADSSPWVETAFGLRLLQLSGYSLRELPVPPAEAPVWDALHESPLAELPGWEPAAGRRFSQVVYDHVEAHAERGLRSRQVAAQILGGRA